MDAIEVLKKGMTTELWGISFYEEAAGRTLDDTGKRVFASLVAEEGKHLEIICGEYAALTQNKGCVSIDEARKLAATVQPTDIFPKAQAAQQLIPAGTSDAQALQMAMDFEERGYRAYTEFAQKAASPQEVTLWDYLAKAENLHYTFIQKTHEFLTTNGVWYFDEKELPFFEG